MDTQIRADEISRVLKEQIQNYNKNVEIAETGSVLSVGDGVARIYGMDNAMAGELVEFPGEILGMVLNLEQDSVGVVIQLLFPLVSAPRLLSDFSDTGKFKAVNI